MAKQEQELTAWIEQIETEVASQEPVKGESSGRLPESLQEAETLRQKIREAMQVLEEQDRQEVNLSEPEARKMLCEGGKRLAYNAQSVVDEASGMIVAQGVSQDTTDHDQFLPMLEQTRQNVGQTATDTVADQGYRSDRNIGQAQERGDSVLVELFEREGVRAEPYHGSRFQYDPRTHECRCPRGQRLVFKGWHKSRHGWMERRYHCDGYRQCAVAKQCSPGQRGRQIYIGPYRKAVDEQRRRQRQEVAKDKLKRRKVIVEPVFAQIKHNTGFRRWTQWGLEGVQAQWAMLCTTHNLKKLLRLWQEGKFQFATC